MPNRVAIIIVTYNGEQYLDALFESLAADTFPKDRLGIFVVDNASTDDTLEGIGNKESGIKNLQLVKNTVNLGFAGGNNIAIQRAMNEGYEWVMLLNQDTVVKPGFIEAALAVAQRDDRIGAVQPLLMLWPPERQEINSLGNEIHFLGFGFCKGYHDSITNPKTYNLKPITSEITYASGAAVLYRTAALRDVGLFDEDFFMYHEDLDLGWRLWLRNWKSVLAPKATVYHKYNFNPAPYKYYYMERNRLLVLLQNYTWQTLVLVFPAWLIMELGMLGYSIAKGWWREKFKGYAWVLRNLSFTLQKRAKIQKNRLVTDREITHRFVGAISYQEIESPVLKCVNPIFSIFHSITRSFVFW